MNEKGSQEGNPPCQGRKFLEPLVHLSRLYGNAFVMRRMHLRLVPGPAHFYVRVAKTSPTLCRMR